MVLLAGLLIATGLSACQTHVGAAAYVGGTRISEVDLNRVVLSNAPAGIGQKSLVLEYLVKAELYKKVDTALGIAPSNADLDATQTDAAKNFINKNLQIPTGASGVTYLGIELLAKLGIAKSFAASMLRAAELEYLTVTRLKISSQPVLTARVSALHINVSVSPRYGTWDPQTLGIATPSTPSFLKLKPVASTPAA